MKNTSLRAHADVKSTSYCSLSEINISQLSCWCEMEILLFLKEKKHLWGHPLTWNQHVSVFFQWNQHLWAFLLTWNQHFILFLKWATLWLHILMKLTFYSFFPCEINILLFCTWNEHLYGQVFSWNKHFILFKWKKHLWSCLLMWNQHFAIFWSEDKIIALKT